MEGRPGFPNGHGGGCRWRQTLSVRMARAARRSAGPLAFVLAIGGAGTALAQDAWVPPKGELGVSMTYQWLDADRHFFSGFEDPELTPFEIATGVDRTSNVVDAGVVQAHSVAFDGELGVTDRLAVNGTLVGVVPRYVGNFAHPASTDDGTFHPSLQDATLGARYMLGDGLWAVTPFAQVTFPTRDYIVLAHASHGLGLSILEVGASAGRILVMGDTLGFIQGTYGYGFTERPNEDIPMNRSRAQLQGGVFLGRVSLLGETNWRKVHGGIEWSDHAHGLDELFSDHDQLAAIREWRYGAGVAFDVTPQAAVYFSFGDFIKGANTHDARTIGFGISLSRQMFGGINLGDGLD